MSQYYRSPTQHKTYKISTAKNVTFLNWVQVYATNEGAFVHARGRDVVPSLEAGKELLDAIAHPCTEQDYINALKDYFAIDKEVRNQFIQKYNL